MPAEAGFYRAPGCGAVKTGTAGNADRRTPGVNAKGFAMYRACREITDDHAGISTGGRVLWR